MTGPQVFLTDFGLAKNVATGSKYTRTGEALGTPQYMSPEQARGETADLTAASDVWALGCVLYELLAARPAFAGPTAAAVIGEVLTVTPPPPAGVPAPVVRFLAASLQRPVTARPADAGAFAEDCRRLLAGDRPHHRPPSRRRAIGAVIGAVATVTAIVVWAARGGDVRLPDDSPLARQVQRAWADRSANPSGALEALEAGLASDPKHHAWRIQAGLLHWAATRSTEATSLWKAVPAHAPEYRRARLLLGMQRFLFEAQGRLLGQEAMPYLRPLCEADDEEGALARAVVAAHEKRWQDARRALSAASSWMAHAVTGYVEGRAPDGDLGLAIRSYTTAEREGLPFFWMTVSRGIAHHRLRQYEQAEATLTRAVAQSPNHPLGLLNRANVRLEMGRAREALADLELALPHIRGHAEAVFARGVAKAHLGDHEGALADFNASINDHAYPARAYALRARLLQVMGRMADADADATRALAAEGLDGTALGALADLRTLQQRWPEARNLVDRALAVDPGDARLHATRSHALLMLGDHAAALTAANRALDLAPDLVAGLRTRAEALRAGGDLQAAITAYGEAIAVGGPDPRLLSNRALCRLDVGEPDRALQDSQAALKLAHDHLGSLRIRAEIYIAQRRLREALADLDRAVAAAPDHAETLSNRGAVHEMLGDLTSARRDLDRACARPDATASAFANRGVVRRKLGDHQGALEDATNALRLQPTRQSALLLRGRSLYDLGRFADARRDLDRLIELDGGSAPAHAARASALERLGQIEGALADFAIAIGKAPEDHSYRFNRGLLFLRRRQWDQARPDLEAVVRLQPEWAQGYGALATALTQLGEWTAAIAAYRRALELDPADQRAEVYRGAIRFCQAKLDGR